MFVVLEPRRGGRKRARAQKKQGATAQGGDSKGIESHQSAGEVFFTAGLKTKSAQCGLPTRRRDANVCRESTLPVVTSRSRVLDKHLCGLAQGLLPTLDPLVLRPVCPTFCHVRKIRQSFLFLRFFFFSLRFFLIFLKKKKKRKGGKHALS